MKVSVSCCKFGSIEALSPAWKLNAKIYRRLLYIVLAVGQQKDACKRVLLLPLGQNIEGQIEPGNDVCGARCVHFADVSLNPGFILVGKALQIEPPLRLAAELDDREPVLVRQELQQLLHGYFHQLQLLALHAAAYIDYAD